MANHLEKYWLLIVVFLLVSLISGGIMLAIKLNSHKPIEIFLSQTAPIRYKNEIYIGGAVANPGFYPFNEEDTIETLIQSAGLTTDADTGLIKVYIPRTSETSQPQPQRININLAEAWLLDALPGIGPDRAQAIVDYRNQNGKFRRIEDLLNVNGIGQTALDEIRGLIILED